MLTTEAPSFPVYTFKYFKGFAHAELKLEQPVTVLIGRNGAGKSNLVEGIHLLGEVTRGMAFYDVGSPGQGRRCEVRGGLPGCPTMGERWFELGCRVGPFRYEIAIRPEITQIEAESLYRNDLSLFEVEDQRANVRRRIVQVTYHPAPPCPLPDALPKETLSADRAVLFSYPSFVEPQTSEGTRQVLIEVERFKELLGAIVVLSLAPASMRDYERTGLGLSPRVPTRDGRNLSAALYDLSQGQETDRESFRRITEAIRQLPEEPFSSVEFITSTAGDVMLALGPAQPDRPSVDARLLSDGTLRYLAILTALETLSEGTLLLLEDFDSGLHPSRVKALLDYLWERCKMRGLRALVTTHNPAVLDALSEERLRGVVVCYRDRTRETAAVCPLLEVPEADLLLERGTLGDLVTRGILEQHLLPRFSEARRQDMLRWLETLP